jgi:hypothetical protein
MRKLIVLSTFLLMLMLSRKASADCICYGRDWETGYEYATSWCLEDVDPCRNTPPMYHYLNGGEWEPIPHGEWPAGLSELVCEELICSACGEVSYDCSDVRHSIRRRYVGPEDGC